MIDAESGGARALAYAALSAAIAANVLGSVFLKLGSSVDTRNAVVLGVFGWQTLLGISFYASGVLFYAWSLKLLPLHTAQAVVALQFIGVILAAAVVFNEVIAVRQWLGIAFILIGLGLVTR
jgi:multidrug transporter EmrE-like cation transporter